MPRTAGALATVAGSQIHRRAEVAASGIQQQVSVVPTHGTTSWPVVVPQGIIPGQPMVMLIVMVSHISQPNVSSISDGVNTWARISTGFRQQGSGNTTFDGWQTTNASTSLTSGSTITLTIAPASSGLIQFFALQNAVANGGPSGTGTASIANSGATFLGPGSTPSTGTQPQAVGDLLIGFFSGGQEPQTLSSCIFSQGNPVTTKATPTSFFPSATTVQSIPQPNADGTGTLQTGCLVTSNRLRTNYGGTVANSEGQYFAGYVDIQTVL